MSPAPRTRGGYSRGRRTYVSAVRRLALCVATLQQLADADEGWTGPNAGPRGTSARCRHRTPRHRLDGRAATWLPAIPGRPRRIPHGSVTEQWPWSTSAPTRKGPPEPTTLLFVGHAGGGWSQTGWGGDGPPCADPSPATSRSPTNFATNSRRQPKPDDVIRTSLRSICLEPNSWKVERPRWGTRAEGQAPTPVEGVERGADQPTEPLMTMAHRRQAR
jgi:hypothetical protein